MAASSGARSVIDTLLQLAPDRPDLVMLRLESEPEHAGAQDIHGYSLVHAAASYNQLDLLRALVLTYKVNVNIVDEDHETPLFAAETLDAARCLVEELKADVTAKNEEGFTAEDNARENIVDGAEWAAVANYLEGLRAPGTASSGLATSDVINQEANGVHAPPPLPPNIRVNLGTMQDAEDMEEAGPPDPEIRRQIEELAAREDFQSEEGQEELRQLVARIVGGLSVQDEDRDVRQRTD